MSDDRNVMILARSTEWHTGEAELFEAACGHRCWISPESRRMLVDRPDLAIVTSCLPCTGRVETDFTSGEIPLQTIPGQRKSLEKILGKERTAEIFRDLNMEEEK